MLKGCLFAAVLGLVAIAVAALAQFTPIPKPNPPFIVSWQPIPDRTNTVPKSPTATNAIRVFFVPGRGWVQRPDDYWEAVISCVYGTNMEAECLFGSSITNMWVDYFHLEATNFYSFEIRH